MDALRRAFRHSAAGWSHALRHERSVRWEVVALSLGLPCALFLTDENWRRLLLVGALVLVLVVEFLNTAIEKLADHVRPEIHPDIKIVKDLGSTAVLMMILLAALVWLLALSDRLWAGP